MKRYANYNRFLINLYYDHRENPIFTDNNKKYKYLYKKALIDGFLQINERGCKGLRYFKLTNKLFKEFYF